ncbi:hypothetical protein Tco_1563151 [Tanacetum coccineum]
MAAPPPGTEQEKVQTKHGSNRHFQTQSKCEKVKQEKDDIEFKIEKFDKASKDIDLLLGSQIIDKSKKGLGYSVVPPPHPLIYNRPNKLDLSYSGLDEFKEPEFKGYGPENSEQESNVVCDKKSDNSKENSKESLVEEQACRSSEYCLGSCRKEVQRHQDYTQSRVVPIKKNWLMRLVHKELGDRMDKRLANYWSSSYEAEQDSAYEEVGEDSYHPTDSDQILIIDQPSTSSQPKQKQKSKRRHESDKERQRRCRSKVGKGKKTSRTIGLRRLKKVGMSRRVESSEDQESLGDHEDASKHRRSIEDIDADAEVTLVNETQKRQDDDLMFDTGFLDDDEVFVDVTTVEKEEQRIWAQTLMEIKAAKPKAKGIVFHDQEEQVFVFKPTVSVTQPLVKDKGKGIMQEPERPLTKKDQVAIDEDLARNIQAQLDAEIIEEERLERQKQEEANIALIKSWENTQAIMEDDRLLAERLQTKER